MTKFYKRIPKFNRKLNKIKEKIDKILNTKKSLTDEEVYIIERSVMQIQIEWELFVRNIILDSATGKFYDKNNTAISSSYKKISSREQASHKLISLYKKRTREPAWYLTAEAIKAAEKLKLSNLSKISAELGVSPWPLEEMRHIRNFIAHQSKSAALSVKGSPVNQQSKNKINIISTITEYSHGGEMKYCIWISFIKMMAVKLSE